MIAPSVQFALNENMFLKDPQSSELGKRLISGSIELINELGFELFTFKKLAKHVGSTEASVYRYFESKHKVLLYLTAWYWNWSEYRLLFRLANVQCPHQRLDNAIDVLTEEVTEDGAFAHINEVKLSNIIICESSKTYLHKAVDEENNEGVYLPFKRLVQHVCDIILEIDPGYKYPHMLVSTIIEGAHMQRYFAEHLPKLTDTVPGEDAVTTCYKHIVSSVLTKD